MDVSLSRYRDLLVTYLGPQWPRVLLLATLLFGGAGLQLLNPQIVRGFIDLARAGGSVEALARAALLFLGVALLTEIVGWTATNALRGDLAQQCLELDLAFHHQHPPGELIERLDGDVTVLANFFSRFVLRLLGSAVLLVGILVLVFREDARIGLVLLAFSVATAVAVEWRRRVGTPYSIAPRQAKAEVFGFVEERLVGLVDVQSVGGREDVLARLYPRLRALWAAVRRAVLVGAVLNVPVGLILTLGSVTALGLSATLYFAGALSLGGVYLIFQYTLMLRQPLDQISRELRDFQQAGACIARILEIVATPRAIQDGPGFPLPDGPLAVDLDRVSFRYRDREAVLDEVSLHLAPGRVLGLLGRTGSGKTTIARLLLRLYDPEAGTIRVGGVDLRATRRGDLRARVALVTQEVELFQASVRDNLTLFDRSIPDEKIRTALRELGLTAWLDRLPDGLATEIGPGAGLSAGEAQLIAFARVFLRDPGLLILDEASSRVDPATQRLVEGATDRLLIGRTAIVIAHRLSTIRRADDVLVLEGGRIAELGRREDLTRDPRSRLAQLLAADAVEVLA
jgi:ATP-binding cassette, subfamily B, bacterial